MTARYLLRHLGALPRRCLVSCLAWVWLLCPSSRWQHSARPLSRLQWLPGLLVCSKDLIATPLPPYAASAPPRPAPGHDDTPSRSLCKTKSEAFSAPVPAQALAGSRLTSPTACPLCLSSSLRIGPDCWPRRLGAFLLAESVVAPSSLPAARLPLPVHSCSGPFGALSYFRLRSTYTQSPWGFWEFP